MKAPRIFMLVLGLSVICLFLSLYLDGTMLALQSSPALPAQSLFDQTEKVEGTAATTAYTTRLSVDSAGNEAYGSFARLDISADGRLVAFVSSSSDLVSGDTNNGDDIFVRDLDTMQTSRVSVDSAGAQSNSISGWPAISADGRYVAFESWANNLVPNDTNGFSDIFVHDRQTGQTTRVSVDSSGAQGNKDASRPDISADGRFVTFSTSANNLVPGDTNGKGDIFVHDRQTGQTIRASVNSNGAQANDNSQQPVISANGQIVAFNSRATNLVAGDINSRNDIFVHDLQTGRTKRVSVASSGAQGNGNSLSTAISADGLYVAFMSDSTNLVTGDSNSKNDIFVHDTKTGQTSRVSVGAGGVQANMRSTYSAVSATGRFVAFDSWASNLLPGITNGKNDVYVHDRLLNETNRISVDSAGVQANDSSYKPAISADGRFVAFSSNANNLIADDTNNLGDVFLRDRGGPGSDTITGNVTDGEGQPLAGVIVQAGSAGMTVTDESGDYVLYDLGSGVYTIEPKHLDYTFSPLTQSVSITDTITALSLQATEATADFLAAANICPAVQFLDLPIPYDKIDSNSDGTPEMFAANLQNWSENGGQINTWFDHSYPWYYDYSDDLLTWDGEVRDVWYKSIGRNGCYNDHCYDGHNGIDFKSSAGPDFIASANGKVVGLCETWPCTNHPYWGNYVILEHEHNYLTVYAHMSSVADDLYLNKPDVTAGNVLGTMGNTGEGDFIHGHFSVACDKNKNHDPDLLDEMVDPYGFEPGPEHDPYVTIGYTANVLSTDGQYVSVHSRGPVSHYLWKHAITKHISAVENSTSVHTDPTGSVTAAIPSGAVSGEATFELGPSPEAGSSAQLKRVGKSIWMKLIEWLSNPVSSQNLQVASTTEAFSFTLPITLDFTYSDKSVKHLDIAQLQIMWRDESTQTWQVLPTTVDQNNNVVSAQTQQIGIFDLQGPLLCASDTFEPDDGVDSALWLTSGDTPLARGFDIVDDQDWYQFPVMEGTEVLLKTQALIGGADTILNLYDTDGETLLAGNDNAAPDGSSELQWIAPYSGIFYIEVLNAPGSTSGCTATYELVMQTTGTQVIQLVAGWNMISSYILAIDTSFDAIFPPEVRDELIICKNDSGEVYWPEHAIADMVWDPHEGYQCYARQPFSIALTGTPVTWENPQPLDQGWNTAAYWLNIPYPAYLILSPIEENLTIAKNGLGQVYWPEHQVDQIGDMFPGQGYQINLEAAEELYYPMD